MQHKKILILITRNISWSFSNTSIFYWKKPPKKSSSKRIKGLEPLLEYLNLTDPTCSLFIMFPNTQNPKKTKQQFNMITMWSLNKMIMKFIYICWILFFLVVFPVPRKPLIIKCTINLQFRWIKKGSKYKTCTSSKY